MKTCSQCNEEKDYDNFVKRTDPKRTRDGYEACCKACKNAKQREYYAVPVNKAAHLRRRRNKYLTDPSFHMYHEAKKRAKSKGLPFTLVKDDIIIPIFCPVLGLKLQVGAGVTLPESPSLDRYYPELGYVKGNVSVISNKANAMKSNGTLEEHLKLIDWMKLMEEDDE